MDIKINGCQLSINPQNRASLMVPRFWMYPVPSDVKRLPDRATVVPVPVERIMISQHPYSTIDHFTQYQNSPTSSSTGRTLPIPILTLS